MTWLLLGISSWYPCLVKTLQCLHCACCNCYYYLIVFMFPETAVKPPWRELFSKNLFQQCAVMVAIDDMKHIASMSGQSMHTLLLRFMCHIALCRGPDFRMAFNKIGGLRALTKILFMCQLPQLLLKQSWRLQLQQGSQILFLRRTPSREPTSGIMS